MAFTRMPIGPSSRARVLVTVASAPFDAAYAPNFGWMRWVDIELTITTRPSPLAARCGTAARVISSVPNRLTSIVRRQSSRSESMSDLALPPSNALFTRMSTLPELAGRTIGQRPAALGVADVAHHRAAPGVRAPRPRRPRPRAWPACGRRAPRRRPRAAKASEMSRPMPGPMPGDDGDLSFEQHDQARQQRDDVGTERADLVDQLVGRARAEAHLDLSDAERRVLAEHVGQLRRRSGRGVRSPTSQSGRRRTACRPARRCRSGRRHARQRPAVRG